MRKMCNRFLFFVVSMMLVCGFSIHASAMGNNVLEGKDQYIEFQNKHYGPMLITFIQEGEMADIQNVSLVILNTGQKILHKFTRGDAQGERTIQVRHFGGVWETKVSGEVNSLSSKDVMKEANCLKPNIWDKKE